MTPAPTMAEMLREKLAEQAAGRPVPPAPMPPAPAIELPAPVAVPEPSPAPQVKAKPEKGPTVKDDGLAGILAGHVMPVILASVQDRIDAAVAQATAAMASGRLVIEATRPDWPEPIEIGVQHSSFPLLVEVFKSGAQGVFLIGPAGSGKTHVGKALAHMFQARYFSQSIGQESHAIDFFGYKDVHGTYHPTGFRNLFELDGVPAIYALDEIDKGPAGVLSMLNQAFGNGCAAFPDGMVDRNAGLFCIGLGNTWGLGADRVYVGSNQLDGSTLDRFPKIFWDYDEILEREVARGILPALADSWTDRVHAIRHAVFALKLRCIVSMRATHVGLKLLRQGIDRPVVEEMMIWNGIPADQKARVLAHMGSK